MPFVLCSLVAQIPEPLLQFLLFFTSSIQFHLLSMANLTISWLCNLLCFFSFHNFTCFQHSLLNSVSFHPGYLFNCKLFSQWSPTPRLFLTLPVASFSYPSTQRLHAALMLPFTSFPVWYHSSICILCFPHLLIKLTFPAAFILFLLLCLSGYQGEKHLQNSKGNFSILI